ncbi:MAG: plastocyanin/azurin family copper-binding protein [Gemmatimonadota bacterium]|nr:plastocyanin/azurin family copper-binding protein [Gemmatimonadota bacterium]
MSRIPLASQIGAMAILTAGTLAVASGCFSERSSITAPLPGPGTAECRIPVGSPLLGASQALIAIRDYSFFPDTVRVKRGTTVTWVNCEPATIDPHTTTSSSGVWSSPFLAPGDIYSHTFDQVGTFPYHCIPHEFMRAVVIVE